MVEAIRPLDDLAQQAGRNAMLLLSMATEYDAEHRNALVRHYLALKCLDPEWTREVIGLFEAHPCAVEQFTGLPLAGSPTALGTFGPFRRALHALLHRHAVGWLFIGEDGAFCPLRRSPFSPDVAVGGRFVAGRWRSAALKAKRELRNDLAHYLRRLGGTSSSACLTASARALRVAERDKHKKAERRVRRLVHDCCSERREGPAPVRRRRAQASR
jgi:hypothetical protein